MVIVQGVCGENQTLPVDVDAAAAALGLLTDPEHNFEVRTFNDANQGFGRIFPAGAYRQAAEHALRAMAADPSRTGSYWGASPVKLPPGTGCASKTDAVKRRWLPCDADPTRGEGGSRRCATEAEREAAIALAQWVRLWTADHGWPDPVEADTGNGRLLLWRIDLPADAESAALVKGGVKALHRLFQAAGAAVDESVTDPCRVLRLPGTMNRKGEDTPDRPHRMCRLVGVPETLKVLDPDKVRALIAAAAAADEATRRRANGSANGSANGTPRAASGLRREEAYFAAVLDAECAAVRAVRVGSGLNTQMNRSAFKVGQRVHLVTGGFRLALDALLAAARAAGADNPAKDEDTLRRALEAGALVPIDPPDREWTGNGRHRGEGVHAPAPDCPPAAPAAEISEEEPGKILLTDLGNAERVVQAFGHLFRYVPEWKGWLVWDGRRWARAETPRVRHFTTRTIKGLHAWAQKKDAQLLAEEAAEADLAEADEAALARRENRRVARLATAAVRAHAFRCMAAARLNAATDLLRSIPGLAVSVADLDADPWLLNCPNGTLDLRTGELREHRQADNLTQLCPTAYDPGASAPLWESTVCSIFGGERLLVEYVRRLAGYCVTGVVRDAMLPICWGSGANGKSVFFKALLAVLGKDYAGPAPDELLGGADGQHPTWRASMFRKRMLCLAETKEGGRLNERQIKTLTGDDPVSARRCGEDPWTFDPTHKVLVATNHRPRVEGGDHGIWRRLRLVPFTQRFWDPARGETGPAELRADRALSERLRAEYPGILAWMVRGCLEWQQSGLNEPPAVLAATNEYREAEDVLGAFVAERCVTGNPAYRVRANELYRAYKAWHEGTGEGRPLGLRTFGERVDGLPGVEKRRSNGWWYVGIAVADGAKS